MNPSLLVGLGGIAGAIARYLVGERVDAHTRDTLAVNVLGSLLLGFLVATPSGPVPEWVQLAAGAGFCGAFTTFSTFAFETVRMAETGETRRAAVNGAANLAGALVAVGVGATLAAAIW